MTMPTVLISFAIFRGFGNQLDVPFTPQENALVQTLAGALAGMPMTAGFTGLVPALEYLTVPSEHGPFVFSIGNRKVVHLGSGNLFDRTHLCLAFKKPFHNP